MDIKEIKFKELTYIKYLNKLIVYDLDYKDLNYNDYYVYKDNKEKRKILLQYKYTYPQATNPVKVNFSKGVKIDNHSTIFIFAIVKDFKIDEDIPRYKIVLNGFRDVIDDRKYVYDIPLVNEIHHNDNFIISNTNTRVCGKVGETIDDIIINYETFRNPCVSTLGYYDKHHKEK